MKSTPSHKLTWSDAWLFEPGPPPVLSAGPDVMFELEGTSPDSIAFVRHCSSGGPVESDLAAEEAEARDLLVGLGALVPLVDEATEISLVGQAHPALVVALEARGMATSRGTCVGPSNDLSLVIRTGQAWPKAPAGLHLGLDLTHNHTFVLGPLVVPGVTSCLMCLQKQTERRWGRDLVPSEPAVSRWPELCAELTVGQVNLAMRGQSPLVNATISWDFEQGMCEREDLLRAPQCGGPCRSPVSDSVDLPWLSQ